MVFIWKPAKIGHFSWFFCFAFWRGGEERGTVHSKIEAMSKNKSLRTSPAKTTKGWHRALGTETTAIFLSPMVSRDYVVNGSAVRKCLRTAPQTRGELNGQEANWLLRTGLCPTLWTSAVKSPAHASATKALQPSPLSCETPMYAKRMPRGLPSGWNKNMGSLEVKSHWLSVTVRKSLHLLVLQSYYSKLA